jgi:quinoprotein glucose dehydrogenase
MPLMIASGRWLYAAVLAAVGLTLVVMGGKLLLLGGSPYYILAGLLAMASGILLALRRICWAIGLYAVLIVATALWAFSEIGLDGWALVPRLVAPAVLGLPFFIMALTKCGWPRGGALAIAAAALVLVAVSARTSTYAEPQALPVAAVSAAAVLSGQPASPPSRFSPLAEINVGNIGKLQARWSTRIGPMPDKPTYRFETVPVEVNGTLYACDAFNDVYALDAETGRIRWHYRAHADLSGLTIGICRGVTYFRVPGQHGVCAERIYTATVDARLIALDAATGLPCRSFGKDGVVNLLDSIKQRAKGYYYATSAPTLADGKLLIGGFVADGQHVGEPSGVVRAFNAATGQLAWAWDVDAPDNSHGPKPGGYYSPGTPNAWAPISSDPQLGLVYVPTGNSTPDYWGGHRSAASNRYASSVVALDVGTGKLRWSFQTTHYDLWDYDVGSEPVLFTLQTRAGPVSALLVPNKRGETFILDRRTGRPLFPVVERRVPQRGAVEHLSPTQPFSPALPSLGGPRLTEKDMWGVTPIDQLWCRIRFREARYEGNFTPPGLTPNIADPGYTGGVGWGSATIDEANQIAVMISNRVVNYDKLISRAEADAMGLKSLLNAEAHLGATVAQEGTPYAANIQPFLSPLGAPCQRPPYGLINAVDLRTGKLLWSRPLGSARDIGPMGVGSRLPFIIGTPTIGGSLMTAGRLTFAGASQDRHFRAFDSGTGRMLFTGDLPFTSQSTAISYVSLRSRRQFVVIASGDASSPYGAISAFSLP